MRRSLRRSALPGGRAAVLTAAAVLVLALPLGSTASAAPHGPAPAPSAAKPEGPVESSLSVAGTGALAAASTVLIVRRHQRRSRNGRR
ncbi:hypothetical protein [Streptomyces sp. NPDC014894]|uniref:hypothetical protein n=1 Tax=Streptomyces sp. NPDC014894 TaxID=3364931 RepID=UPI0036FD6737